MEENGTILVTGATGNVGRPLVARLLAAGHTVRALTRNPSDPRVPQGAEAVPTDDLGAALDGAAAVYLNPAVFWQSPGELLRLAGEKGVRRVVTLSSSSVAYAGMAPGNMISAHHQELEGEVEAVAAAAGMEWTHVRPDMFATNTLSWADQVRRTGVVRIAHAAARVVPVHEADIAAVSALALTGSGFAGRAPVLTGPEEITQAEQVRLIGEAIGRPVRCEEIPPAEARAGMVASGTPEPVAEALLDVLGAAVHTPVPVSPEVERITGSPARSYASWARDHAADFA